jgi:hypothetical protein
MIPLRASGRCRPSGACSARRPCRGRSAASGTGRRNLAGALTRDGEDLAVSIRLADSADGLTATLSARDFRAVDIPLQNVRLEDGRLSFDLAGDARPCISPVGRRETSSRARSMRTGVRDVSASSADRQPAKGRAKNGPRLSRTARSRCKVRCSGPRDAAANPPAVLLMHGSGAESRAAGRFLATASVRRRGGGADLRQARRGRIDRRLARRRFRRSRRVTPGRPGLAGGPAGCRSRAPGHLWP